MAELTRPKYNIPRFNRQSAKGSAVSMPSTPLSGGSNHNQKMADIAIRGIMQLEDAYDNAEAQQIRLELAEEKVLVNKHIGDQDAIVDNNLKSVNANFLNPRNLEENFKTDGQKMGEYKLAPYEVSDDLSDKAKELIQPKIDLANNDFNRNTQTKFTGELQRRSKVRIDDHTLKTKEVFEGQITKDIAEKKLGTTIFMPNQYAPAEKAANDYEAFLREEMKYKTIDEPTLKLKVYKYKQELAGMIFDRHVAQDPSGAMDQYIKIHKVKKNAEGEPIYTSAYEVGGVSMDSSRISKLVDAYVKTENSKIEQTAYNAFKIREKSLATRQPLLALQKYGIKNTTATQIENALGHNIPVNIETWTADLSKIDLDKHPYLDAAMLEEIVATAVLSRESHIKLAEKRNKSRLDTELKFSLGSDLFEHRHNSKTKWYNFDAKKGGWRPKPDQVQELAIKYRLDPQVVETSMIHQISPYAHIKAGNGVPSEDLIPFQNSIVTWYHDTTQVHRGFAQKTEEDSAPHMTEKGKSFIKTMNADQQQGITSMIVDLDDIKTLKKNYKTIPLSTLANTFSEYSRKFTTKDNRMKIQGDVWSKVGGAIAKRIEMMNTMPVLVALQDMKYYEWAFNVHHQLPMVEGGPIPERSEKAKDDIIKYMRKMGIWGNKKRENFLPTANEAFFASDLSRFGIDEDPTDNILEKLNPAE